jgi:hypothetical protein
MGAYRHGVQHPGGGDMPDKGPGSRSGGKKPKTKKKK